MTRSSASTRPSGWDRESIRTRRPLSIEIDNVGSITGDPVFDACVIVRTDNDEAARRFLDGGTRSTIVAFFEAGASSIITDDKIQVVATGSAGHGSSDPQRGTNDAVLSERHAEL